jgi:hypothetical protein
MRGRPEGIRSGVSTGSSNNRCCSSNGNAKKSRAWRLTLHLGMLVVAADQYRFRRRSLQIRMERPGKREGEK